MMIFGKKTAALLLSLFILLSITAVNVSADSEPSFELTKVYGDPGETVQIELIINNNPGITALSVDIGYSSDDLELIGIDNAGLFEDPISVGMLSANPIPISWYAGDSGDKTDNGTVAILKFKIREGADNSAVTISYNPENVINSAIQNKPFATVNGMVGIGEEPIEPPRPYILGDVDDDGEVTVVDATYIQRKATRVKIPLTDEEMLHGDVDGDGEVTVLDATYIQRYATRVKVPYPIGERHA